MEGRLLLNVVIREGPTIFELLAGEDEALLIRGDALLVLDLALYIVDCVAGFDFERDWRKILDLNSERTTDNGYVLVLPVRVFTKICIPPRKRSTRCKVDSFWML